MDLTDQLELARAFCDLGRPVALFDRYGAGGSAFGTTSSLGSGTAPAFGSASSLGAAPAFGSASALGTPGFGAAGGDARSKVVEI